jgi:hypothetical protein
MFSARVVEAIPTLACHTSRFGAVTEIRFVGMRVKADHILLPQASESSSIPGAAESRA